MNMSMLKSFFEIGGNPALFDGLNFESASAALRTLIGNEARRFDFLRSSVRLSEDEKESYARLTKTGSGEEGLYAMTEKMAAASLQTLSQLLEKHYGQKVILLIDEYDVPLDKAFQGGYYDEMVSLIRNLLGNALKTNDSLYFAVLTGCLRIPKESIFTGLNNLKVHTISDVRYDEHFGFTNADVDELLEFYGLSSYKDVIRDWYDGYHFGDTDIYCPWDVINYCDELLAAPGTPPKNCWANTSGNDLIRRMLKNANLTTKDEVEELLSGGQITKCIKQELTYREIDDSIENVWSVLYATGYLTGMHVEQEMLDDYLWDSISVRDTAVRRNMKENFYHFYHWMLLGLLQSQDSWLVKSNAETGEGYSDISIQTPERLGIVIELKYADDGNLEKGCSEALKQIEEKKYAEGLKRRGMKKILWYGIAFWEKECMAAME